MGSDFVQVNWEARQKILFTNLNTLRKKEIHTDVILSCEGKTFSAHRLILTMGSGYFTKAFEGITSTPPSLVFICGIRYSILEALLNFIYEGKATIQANDIPDLSKAGVMLEVPGLMELGKEYSSISNSFDDKKEEIKGTKDVDPKQSKSFSNNVKTDAKLENLAYHIEEHYYKPRFTCSHCGKTFNIEKNYHSHLSTHEITKEKENTVNNGSKQMEGNSNSHIFPEDKASKKRKTIPENPPKDCTIDDVLKSVSQSFEMLSDDQQFNVTDDSIYENALGSRSELSSVNGQENEKITAASIGRLKELLNLNSGVESVNTRVCRFCNVEFLSSKAFRIHRATECKTLECQYCLQNFEEKADYDSHVLIHKGIIRPYTCSECTFCTDKKWNFEDHVSLHTGIYRFWCLLCEFQAKRFCDLKTHTNICHPEVNVNALETLVSK
ncbi:Zinc finger and BTB domain-containing protein 24 [Armadillidium nasatum]|uniref:Zinc finger and BTB domain-containing protein 24 n=1 Tax=Armadillidium nasatum TaxID=96803 RepID=A0A5N5TN18_9CRUS|nr:Zinc finger and BTB domain-containing protein 24 [Armadillidium nasatum]